MPIRKILTLTGLVWNANMVAVSLFWNTDICAVTETAKKTCLSYLLLKPFFVRYRTGLTIKWDPCFRHGRVLFLLVSCNSFQTCIYSIDTALVTGMYTFIRLLYWRKCKLNNFSRGKFRVQSGSDLLYVNKANFRERSTFTGESGWHCTVILIPYNVIDSAFVARVPRDFWRETV